MNEASETSLPAAPLILSERTSDEQKDLVLADDPAIFSDLLFATQWLFHSYIMIVIYITIII